MEWLSSVADAIYPILAELTIVIAMIVVLIPFWMVMFSSDELYKDDVVQHDRKDLSLSPNYSTDIADLKKITNRSYLYSAIKYFRNQLEERDYYNGIAKFRVILEPIIKYYLKDQDTIKSLTIDTIYIHKDRYQQDGPKYAYNPLVRYICVGKDGKVLKRDVVMSSLNTECWEPTASIDPICMCVNAVRKSIEYFNEELKEDRYPEGLIIGYGKQTWRK